MLTKSFNCTSNITAPMSFIDEINADNILCLSNQFAGDNIADKTPIYTYVYMNQTGIHRNLSTQIGYYEGSGVILDVEINDRNKYNQIVKDLEIIINPKLVTSDEVYLKQNIKGIELSFVTIEPAVNVYVINLLVRKKSYLNS